MALHNIITISIPGFFGKLNEMGNTIIVIIHDLSVAAHAKRTVKIIDGELFE